ncbi:MAG: phosphotransferase [Pseudomonadota bacterium]
MTDYANFLSKTEWAGAETRPLAGDASNRRYLRVSLGERRAVLMDAARDRGEDTAPFIQIAEHLRGLGLHAPEIFAADRAAGLLLLEDLGDTLYARLFEAQPALESRLYTGAIDVLLHLHRSALPRDEVPDYTAETMSEAAKLAAIWYAEKPERGDEVGAGVLLALKALDWSSPVLVLRDYHAENLIWIDDEAGLNRVGLLDFQDAALGHPVYDVISLMQDARRDVARTVAADMARQYQDGAGMAVDAFDHAAAVLGAQRALRILGVFARLSLHYNKPHYVDLIPRVWDQLQENLRHAALEPLAELVRDILPEPDAKYLHRMKARAGTCPTL